MDFSYLLMNLGLLLGAVIGLLLRYVLFRASCALVDAEPSHFKSILIVLFALAIALAVGIPMLLLGTFIFPVAQAPVLFLLWCFLGLLIIWLLLGLLYIPALPVSFTKGFLLSGYEMILGLLLNSLLLGVFLVVYAVYQMITNTGAAHTEILSPTTAALLSTRLL